MRYFGELKGLGKEDAKNRSLKYFKRVGSEYANTRLDKLSGGQQQKIQLGVTIINNPELLILDEPTEADPVSNRLLMDIIDEHRQTWARPSYLLPTRWKRLSDCVTGYYYWRMV